MKRWLWVFALCAMGACSDSTEPDDNDGGVTEGELKFLRFSSATAVTVRQKSFYAVRGRDRKLEIDDADGEDFLEFEVRAETLLRRPNGTLFQNGDSVLITVTLDANNRFIVNFEPSGLTFNPADPARLKINYHEADDDIDDDGDHDSEDDRLESLLRMWQQERAGLPWVPLLSFRIDDDDIEARILSFTGFAMASN
jgi:hypothetical protein